MNEPDFSSGRAVGRTTSARPSSGLLRAVSSQVLPDPGESPGRLLRLDALQEMRAEDEEDVDGAGERGKVGRRQREPQGSRRRGGSASGRP